ncbi:hypothetical protein [Naasia sp. SYSU D00948]|uniref:hypothetical protein n=1 Tax=Naasia sp. SYSU D00948 TaxID=2817379 RepID=UPI001B3051C9|nr:hypothetical protein [Naasia sp. SYSU D00948]
MNDLKQMTTPVLQDWWERYTCPACMSKSREIAGFCGNPWHTIPAVTYECEGSSFSPLSIPVAELQQAGLLGRCAVPKYGLVWTKSTGPARSRRVLGFV